MIPMNTTTRDQIAAEVRAATARAGITHADLAGRTGMSTQSIRRKLRGERGFNVEELVAIANAVGCRPSDLLPREDVAPPGPAAHAA